MVGEENPNTNRKLSEHNPKVSQENPNTNRK
jgi:hypothetical protein